MIYTHEQSKELCKAMEKVMLSSVGYSNIGSCPTIANAMLSAGFMVQPTNNGFVAYSATAALKIKQKNIKKTLH